MRVSGRNWCYGRCVEVEAAGRERTVSAGGELAWTEGPCLSRPRGQTLSLPSCHAPVCSPRPWSGRAGQTHLGSKTRKSGLNTALQRRSKNSRVLFLNSCRVTGTSQRVFRILFLLHTIALVVSCMHEVHSSQLMSQ